VILHGDLEGEKGLVASAMTNYYGGANPFRVALDLVVLQGARKSMVKAVVSTTLSRVVRAGLLAMLEMAVVILVIT
jgi:hypothetical protein